jgi:DNA gyrase subunit A
MDVVDGDAALVVVTAKGYAKQTPLAEYPTQGRYGKGIATFAAKALAQTGPLAGACVAREDDEVGIVSTAGTAVRLKVSDIPAQNRSTRGSAIVQMKATDKVTGVTLLLAKPQAPSAAVQGAGGKKRPTSRRRSSTKKPAGRTKASATPAKKPEASSARATSTGRPPRPERGRSNGKASKKPAAKAPVASGKTATKKPKRIGKG